MDPWDLDEAIALRGENADERATIMYKYRKYPRGRFYNEVMGLSYDDATCPITISDLIDACDRSCACGRIAPGTPCFLG